MKYKVPLQHRILIEPKPIPYYLFKQKLLSEGYSKISIVTSLMDLCSNSQSHKTASIHKDNFYIMDGLCQPFIENNCSIVNPEKTNSFVTIKQKLNEKYLLILPCTGTAKDGNYFLANTWREMSMYFPERMSTLDFAAVDCIIAKYGDKEGLIVFENEMDRVKGFDQYPIYNKELVLTLNSYMKKSIDKLKQYKKILIYLNVRLYREVVENNKLENMIFIDMPFRQGSFKEYILTLRKKFDEVINEI